MAPRRRRKTFHIQVPLSVVIYGLGFFSGVVVTLLIVWGR